MFFSKITNGFYDEALKSNYGDNWPKDALRISDELHQELLKGQTQGKIICSDSNGLPILKDAPQAPALIPTITKRQAMLQLNIIGLYDELLEMIGKTENKQLKIEFEYSTTFERESPFIIAMADQFKLSDSAVDSLFIEAAQL